MLKWLCILATLSALLSTRPLCAQGNYEIQVYGAATVEPKSTMVELHSNFTPVGQKNQIDGVYPTNRQLHETLEITQGVTSWSEVGFYIFTSEQNGHGVQWVGSHIRPRVRVPDAWRTWIRRTMESSPWLPPVGAVDSRLQRAGSPT